MKQEFAKPLVVACPHCNESNVFNQPYPYHAGFSDQGFLYNEAGNCTLIWSASDPDFEALVESQNPWLLGSSDRSKLEAALQPAPDGSRWLFKNAARCTSCGNAISGPITDTIYYLVYEGSVDVDSNPDCGLKDVLRMTVEK